MKKQQLPFFIFCNCLFNLTFSQVNTYSSSNLINDNLIIEYVGVVYDVWAEKSKYDFEIYFENPNCRDFIIFAEELSNKQIVSNLYNINGIRIDSQKIVFNPDGYASFLAEELPQGMYLIKLLFDGHISSDKIIINCE